MSNKERMTIIGRSLEEAMYIVSKNASIKETAEVFGITEEMVFIDITEFLNKETDLYKAVRKVLSKDEYYINKIKAANRISDQNREYVMFPLIQNSSTQEAAREFGMFMVTHNMSLEEAAREFGITSSTAYEHITQNLNKDTFLYQSAMEIIENHNSIQKINKKRL